MGASQLRKQISEHLESLSEEHLRVADHFIAYLREHENNPATAELLEIEGFSDALRLAEHQAASGKTVPLSEVHRDA